MLTTTKIALVAALVAGSASVASAQGFDPNPANRYPAYAAPGGQAQPYLGYTYGPAASQITDSQRVISREVASRGVASRGIATRGALRSAPVSLYQGPARTERQNGSVYYGGSQQDGFEIDRTDRASAPYAGGVN